MEKTSLEALLEDRDEVDIEVAVGILESVLRIDSASGDLRPLGDFDHLSGTGKIAALALGYRAAVALKKREANGFRMNDLVSWSGMAKGTVGRELAALSKKHLLDKRGRGIYDVPGHAVRKLVLIIKEGLRGN